MLDLDATDDPIHGHQERRFFHGYYECYCFFCGRHVLAAKLRRSNIDASAGSVEEAALIVARIRERWGRLRILLRGDSGFAREVLMAWCEANRVDYVFGLQCNTRLEARHFADFPWTTLDSWSRRPRVVAKAEWSPRGANPRFIVSSLKAREFGARALYEDLYCARGEMENRIKGEERPRR